MHYMRFLWIMYELCVYKSQLLINIEKRKIKNKIYESISDNVSTDFLKINQKRIKNKGKQMKLLNNRSI